MIDPVDVKEIATAAIAAGAIVFLGALYAIFFALGQLRGNTMMVQLGYGAYAFLVAATWVFARALDLSGIWLVLIAILLVGYLIAPQFIWRLSVATHKSDTHQGDTQ